MKPISISIDPIGKVVSPLSQKFGIPRQPNLVAVPAMIELFEPFYHPDAVKGLEQFSHLWVIWQFHAVKAEKQPRQNQPKQNGLKERGLEDTFRPLVRPPRLGGNEKIGVFASRSMFRPNRMGMSVVKLESIAIEHGMATLHISGADMLDGTPVLDIKPYIAYSDSVPEAVSGYASEPPILKPVEWDAAANDVWQQYARLTESDKNMITALIAQDPRPAYQTQAASGKMRTYTMRYKLVDVVFYEKDDTLVICDVIDIKKPLLCDQSKPKKRSDP